MVDTRYETTALVPYDTGKQDEIIEGEFREVEDEDFEPQEPRLSSESQRIEDELRDHLEAVEAREREQKQAEAEALFGEIVRETPEAESQREKSIDELMQEERERMEGEHERERGEKADKTVKKFLGKEEPRLRLMEALGKRGYSYAQAKDIADRYFSKKQRGTFHLPKSPKFKASTLRNVLTLGGPIKANKRTRELYLASGLSGRVKPSMKAYDISGMRALTAPGGLGAMRGVTSGGLSKLREATMPQTPQKGGLGLQRPTMDLSQLREAGRLGASPLKVNLNFDVLRRMAVPRGWSRAEAMAFQEIVENHDQDTRSHVISELMALGVGKAEASKAISSLLRRRVIKQEGRFRGEPVLEVTR